MRQGNVYSERIADAKRSNDRLVFKADIIPYVAANKNLRFPILVPVLPGYVKFQIESVIWTNGPVDGQHTDNGTYIILENASIPAGVKTIAGTVGQLSGTAAYLQKAGSATYAPMSLTLATTPSDRSAAGWSATEPDVNLIPGDLLYARCVTKNAAGERIGPGVLTVNVKCLTS